MVEHREPRVVFQPLAGQALRRGSALLVDAVAPTLGPRPRFVAVERNRRNESPELLDQAGVIGRRILSLGRRDEDVGAMLVRHLMWRMYDRVGDGAATAALLFKALYEGGLRYVAAGGNAMLLRRHLESAGRVVDEALTGQSQAVEGPEQLAHLARAVCFDEPLAKLLGEIFDIIGEYGHLEIRTGRGRNLDREYVEGVYWQGGLLARGLATDAGRGRAELEDAAVLVTNLEVSDVDALVECLGRVAAAGVKHLLIIARSFSTQAMSVLLVNNGAGKMLTVAVKAQPGASQGDYEDVAILTGARPFFAEAGETLKDVRAEHLGRTRRAWADKDYFGLVGVRGDPRNLRARIAALRGLYGRAMGDERQALRRRIGRLQGGAATLWIGAATESEMETRKNLAERTAESLRAALLEGAVPGGGAALLACRPTIRRCKDDGQSADERAAYRIVGQALEAPARTIIRNSGEDEAAAMAAIDAGPPGTGYDVNTGRATLMAEAGVLDVAGVTRLAFSSALSAAVMALTTDVLVHRKQAAQLTSTEP